MVKGASTLLQMKKGNYMAELQEATVRSLRRYILPWCINYQIFRQSTDTVNNNSTDGSCLEAS